MKVVLDIADSEFNFTSNIKNISFPTQEKAISIALVNGEMSEGNKGGKFRHTRLSVTSVASSQWRIKVK